MSSIQQPAQQSTECSSYRSVYEAAKKETIISRDEQFLRSMGRVELLPKYAAGMEQIHHRVPSNRFTNRFRNYPPVKATVSFDPKKFLEGMTDEIPSDYAKSLSKITQLASNMLIREMDTYQGECDLKISMTDQLYRVNDNEFIQVFNINPRVDSEILRENGIDEFVDADISKSMQGIRFQNLKLAICDKIDKMGPRDRIQVTLFGSKDGERVLLPLMVLPTPEDKNFAKTMVDKSEANGTATYLVNSLQAIAIGLNESDKKSKGSRGRIVHVVSDGATHDDNQPSDPRLHDVLRNMAGTDFTLSTIGIGVDHVAEKGLRSLATVFGGKYVDVERSGTSISQELNNIKPSVTVFEMNDSQLYLEGDNIEVIDLYSESEIAPKINKDRFGTHISGIGSAPFTSEKTRSLFVKFRVKDLTKPLKQRMFLNGKNLINNVNVKREYATTVSFERQSYTDVNELPAIVHYAEYLKVVVDIIKTISSKRTSLTREDLANMVYNLKSVIKSINSYPFSSSVAKLIDLLQNYRDQNDKRLNVIEANIQSQIESFMEENDKKIKEYEQNLKSMEAKLAIDLFEIDEKNRIDELEKIDQMIVGYINVGSSEVIMATKMNVEVSEFKSWLKAEEGNLDQLLKRFPETMIVEIKKIVQRINKEIEEKGKLKKLLKETKYKTKLQNYEVARTNMIQLYRGQKESIEMQLKNLNDEMRIIQSIADIRKNLEKVYVNDRFARLNNLLLGCKFATLQNFQAGHQSIQEQAVFEHVIKRAYKLNCFTPGIFRDTAELIYAKPELSENSFLTSTLRKTLSLTKLPRLPKSLVTYISFLATPIRTTMRTTTVSPAIPAWDAMLFYRTKEGILKVSNCSLSALYTLNVHTFFRGGKVYLTDADAGGHTGEVCFDDLLGVDKQWLEHLSRSISADAVRIALLKSSKNEVRKQIA